MICEYGCDKEAKYKLKNGKWCCSESYNSCPFYRKKKSIQMKKIRRDPSSIFNSKIYKQKQRNGLKNSWKNPTSGFNLSLRNKKISKAMTEEWKDPNSIYNSNLYKQKQKVSSKLTIEKINIRYPFFSKIEEMRYNPDKPGEKEIQVHCKNHNCPNSKEKGGWFIPTYIQLYERIRQIENKHGNGGCYLYCSQECKDKCVLFKIRNDPFKDIKLPYTQQEYQTFRKFVLERDNYKCQFCGKKVTNVHHEYPQKLEPFFSLDPDYAWSCCEKCHYKYGHKDECNTGNLAKIICSTESQKFLNQK